MCIQLPEDVSDTLSFIEENRVIELFESLLWKDKRASASAHEHKNAGLTSICFRNKEEYKTLLSELSYVHIFIAFILQRQLRYFRAKVQPATRSLSLQKQGRTTRFSRRRRRKIPSDQSTPSSMPRRRLRPGLFQARPSYRQQSVFVLPSSPVLVSSLASGHLRQNLFPKVGKNGGVLRLLPLLYSQSTFSPLDYGGIC